MITIQTKWEAECQMNENQNKQTLNYQKSWKNCASELVRFNLSICSTTIVGFLTGPQCDQGGFIRNKDECSQRVFLGSMSQLLTPEKNQLLRRHNIELKLEGKIHKHLIVIDKHLIVLYVFVLLVLVNILLKSSL